MAKKPDFDRTAAHKYFSVKCFNAAWDLMDKPDRTTEESQEMLRLSMTSLFHWSQRDDCTNQNKSVGYWQVSRIFVLLEQVENAHQYANFSLEASHGEQPFFLYRYAYEALARAESQAGNTKKGMNTCNRHLSKQRKSLMLNGKTFSSMT
jgi:hypothetical protein